MDKNTLEQWAAATENLLHITRETAKKHVDESYCVLISGSQNARTLFEQKGACPHIAYDISETAARNAAAVFLAYADGVSALNQIRAAIEDLEIEEEERSLPCQQRKRKTYGSTT